MIHGTHHGHDGFVVAVVVVHTVAFMVTGTPVFGAWLSAVIGG